MKTKSLLIIETLAIALFLAACSKAPAPSASAQPAATPAPTAESAPFNLSKVFPDGPGRDKVMNTCGSCHPLVCVTRGQRTPEQWQNIKSSHRDKLTNAPAADLDAMFQYLAANFNDKKPEPQVPAELAQQGCTPF